MALIRVSGCGCDWVQAFSGLFWSYQAYVGQEPDSRSVLPHWPPLPAHHGAAHRLSTRYTFHLPYFTLLQKRCLCCSQIICDDPTLLSSGTNISTWVQTAKHAFTLFFGLACWNWESLYSLDWNFCELSIYAFVADTCMSHENIYSVFWSGLLILRKFVLIGLKPWWIWNLCFCDWHSHTFYLRTITMFFGKACRNWESLCSLDWNFWCIANLSFCGWDLHFTHRPFYLLNKFQ